MRASVDIDDERKKILYDMPLLYMIYMLPYML